MLSVLLNSGPLSPHVLCYHNLCDAALPVQAQIRSNPSVESGGGQESLPLVRELLTIARGWRGTIHFKNAALS